MNKIHKKEDIAGRGEVFTPKHLVKEILNLFPQEMFSDSKKTLLDNSCGNGNFLIEALHRKIKCHLSHLEALKTIYGIEIDEVNVAECKQRLSLGSTDKDIWTVLNHNIICADTLDSTHSGWEDVGYMWERFKEWQTIDGVLQPKQKASVLSNIRKRYHYD
jgi:type I restriction-modification system DNA methylase subunit